MLPALLAIALLSSSVWASRCLAGRRRRVLLAFEKLEMELERRHRVVPLVLAAVRQAAGFPQKIIADVATAMEHTQQQSLVPQQQALAEMELDQSLEQLLTALAAFPLLRADQHFAALAEELTTVENRVSLACQVYCDAVLSYNDLVESFPCNLIASMAGFRCVEPFYIDSPASHQP